jgi:hypothetical protein
MVGRIAARLERREKYIKDLRRTVMEGFETIDEIINFHDNLEAAA